MDFLKRNNTHNTSTNNIMIKKITLSIIAILFTININAQAPELFNYQAVVRDGSGVILANQSVGIQIRILKNSAAGTEVYNETHSKTTNAFGLVNIAIGSGTVVNGVFANIEWALDNYFIEVGIDPAGGTSYTITGTSQLLSVPYALYAKDSGSSYWNEQATGIFYNDGNVGVGNGSTVENLSKLAVLSNTSNPASNNIKIKNQNDSGVSRLTIADSDNGQLVFGINNSNVATGANEAFLWYFENNDFKIGTNSAERMRITAGGNVGIGTPTPNSKLQITGGDIYIENINSGVIMKSPNGTCFRMTVSNAGAPIFTSITCP